MDVEQAKKWFLATKIPVFVNTRIDTFQGTCITIALASSAEVENTLADQHYEVEELVPAAPSGGLTPKFTPSYDADNGVGTLIGSMTTDLFYEGMVLVNPSNGQYQILEVLDDKRFTIAPQPVVDLNNVTLWAAPLGKAKVQVGSVAMRETFTIGVHETTDAYHCIVLHSILVFILLRYRKTLFEHRGLERTKFSSSDFLKSEDAPGEITYQRYINFEATVRHYWPLERSDIAQDVVTGLHVIPSSDSVRARSPNLHVREWPACQTRRRSQSKTSRACLRTPSAKRCVSGKTPS
jgi:hypothetical protein